MPRRPTGWCARRGHGRRRPTLDDSQQAVVDHPGGPLLVLAGPGTGKTTTLVEAIVDRIENRGASPDSVLALTFSRKAAEQLRDRVTARLGRTTSTTLCSTFHSFAYGLIRQYSPADLYAGPLRLLSAPEQDVVLRELLAESPEAVQWPAGLQRASQTRGFAHEVAAVLARAREKGLDADGAAPARHASTTCRSSSPPAGSSSSTSQNLDAQGATDYADLIRRAVIEAADHQRRAAGPVPARLRRRVPGHRPRPGAAAPGDRRRRRATSPSSVTRTSRSTRSAAPRCAGILDFPDQFRAARRRPGRRAGALASYAASAPRVLTASQRVAARIPLTGSIDERRPRARSPRPRRSTAGRPDRVEVFTVRHRARRGRARSPTCCGGPTSRTASRGREMAVLVRSGRTSIPVLRRGARARPACPSRWPATRPRWCASPPCARCSTRCAPWSTSTTTTPTTPTTSTRWRPRAC